MKCRIKVVLSVLIILAFLMPNEVVYAKEKNTSPEYYKEMIEGISDVQVCIDDCSYSMNNTFSYERKIIKSNLSEVVFNKNYVINKSDIWDSLNFVAEYYDNIVLISDLWDTTQEELLEAENMSLIVMVPYWSDNEEAKIHVEEVVVDKILPFWNHSQIVVIYLDSYVDVYSDIC